MTDWRDSPWRVFKARMFVIAVLPWAKPIVDRLAKLLTR